MNRRGRTDGGLRSADGRASEEGEQALPLRAQAHGAGDKPAPQEEVSEGQAPDPSERTVALRSRPLSEYLQSGPCLEEMDGFRQQRLKDGNWSGDDQAMWLVWRRKLETGQEVPAPLRMPRAWEYKRGKPAVRKKVPRV